MSGYYKRITDEIARDRQERRARRSSASMGLPVARILKRALIATAVFVVASLAIVYIGDYIVIYYRVAAQKNAYGEVTLQPYYAMHLKNGRTEFSFQPEEQERCVNSLFPHFGMSPCWYLRRHPEKRTDI